MLGKEKPAHSRMRAERTTDSMQASLTPARPGTEADGFGNTFNTFPCACKGLARSNAREEERKRRRRKVRLPMPKKLRKVSAAKGHLRNLLAKRGRRVVRTVEFLQRLAYCSRELDFRSHRGQHRLSHLPAHFPPSHT